MLISGCRRHRPGRRREASPTTGRARTSPACTRRSPRCCRAPILADRASPPTTRMPRRRRRSSGSTPGRCLGRTRGLGGRGAGQPRHARIRARSPGARAAARRRQGRLVAQPRLPGLRPNERLVRRHDIPKRAPILAKDGTPLAEGPADARTSPLGAAATAIVGKRGHAQATSRSPSSRSSASRPGARPGRAASSWRSTSGSPAIRAASSSPSRPAARRRRRAVACSPRASRSPASRCTRRSTRTSSGSAVAALGGTYGGVAVLDARTGEVRALAGIAFSAPQPPGSTFKLITTTAALESGDVKVTDTVPDPDVHDGRRQADRQRQPRGLRRNLRPRRSPSRATASSRRSGPRSARRAWSAPPSATASTPHRRSTTESAVNAAGIRLEHAPEDASPATSTSRSRRSARVRCSRRPSRWRPSPRRSPTAACSTRRRS